MQPTGAAILYLFSPSVRGEGRKDMELKASLKRANIGLIVNGILPQSKRIERNRVSYRAFLSRETTGLYHLLEPPKFHKFSLQYKVTTVCGNNRHIPVLTHTIAKHRSSVTSTLSCFHLSESFLHLQPGQLACLRPCLSLCRATKLAAHSVSPLSFHIRLAQSQIRSWGG